ncbi:hypothetical protein OG900_09825 [Streptomyces sp. NBC_00433]
MAWWQVRLAVPQRQLRLLSGAVVGMVAYLFTLLVALAGHVARDSGAMGVAEALDFIADIGWMPLFILMLLPPLGEWLDSVPDTVLLLTAVPAVQIAIGVLLIWLNGLRARSAPVVGTRWSGGRRELLIALSAALTIGIPLGVLTEAAIGVMVATVLGLVTVAIVGWTSTPTDLTAIASPAAALGRDRRVFRRLAVSTVIAASCVVGPLLGVLLALVEAMLSPNDHTLLKNLEDGLGMGFLLGFWSSILFGPAAALTRTASGPFHLARYYLMLRHRLPRDLMAFMEDAHTHHGVFRQVGSLYQFRHLDLQHHLERREDGQ